MRYIVESYHGNDQFPNFEDENFLPHDFRLPLVGKKKQEPGQ